ncbi:MAG: hypothetical protein RI988_3196 [Pseudomonadota bacterium]|jgi:hypothetical protein
MFATGDSFSYDFANYRTYLLSLQEADWPSLLEFLPLTFPYVIVPGGAAFELGFAALAKGLLALFRPETVYALIAGASVGLRTFAMRRLGLQWRWILVVQVYAITLFEANALRAGVALSLTIWALLMFSERRWLLAAIGAVAAAGQHLQAALFLMPYVVLLLVPQRVLRMRALALLALVLVPALVVTGQGLLGSSGLVGGAELAKLDDYSGRSSGAVGLNLVSVLSSLFVLAAVLFGLDQDLRPHGRQPEPPFMRATATSRTWVCSLYASIFALSLLIFGTNLSAIGDRAWQFALVVLATLSPAMAQSSLGRRLRGGLLGLVFAVALFNTLVRYPLSNFFSPPLPYASIIPLWLVP